MWRDHPPGTYLLCTVELLERTSYYGMRALLVLLMVAPLAGGGLGWAEPEALAFYGVFTGAVWCSPLVGGLVIDRWLGLRRAVPIGGICLILGYLSLVAASVLPGELLVGPGLSLRAALDGTGTPLGTWLDAGALASLSVAPSVGGEEAAGMIAKVGVGADLVAVLFMGGLALVVAGNGLFKPSVTLMIGELYRQDDPSRERAYLLFYMSIYVGVLVAGVVVGTVGERLGWPLGLAVALATMAAALATYLSRQSRWLNFASNEQGGRSAGCTDQFTVRQATLYIGTHAIFAMVFWAAYEQSGGLLSLFVLEQVDRDLLSAQVPATWFFSLTSVFAIAIAPFLPGMIARWEARHRPLHVSDRFAIGLVFGGLAFAVMTAASVQAQSQAISMLWPLGFYALLTVGELMFSPTGFAMVGRIAPRDHQSAFMGLWLLSIALGSYLGGQIGALSHSVGRTQTFAGLGIVLVAGSVLMLAFGPTLRRVTDGSGPR